MKKIAAIILGIFFAYLLFLAIKTNQVYKKIKTNNTSKITNKTEYNFLIFGYGGGNHEGTYLTDTMMIFHLDTKNKKAALVSIPRDLYVKIPTVNGENFYSKINAVYQMELFSKNYPNIDKKALGKTNDANLVKTILGKIFGIEIDGYVSIDFDGFTKFIDSLGGIDVYVEKSFVDKEYPIEGKEKDLCNDETKSLFEKAQPILNNSLSFEEKEKNLTEDKKLDEFIKNATLSPELAFPCRYETIEFKKGLTHMDGKTALKFSRSRHSEQDGGDFSRARRQHQVIEAVKNKLLSFDVLRLAPKILDQLGDHLRTDLSLSEMISRFSKELPNVSKYSLYKYVLSNENFLTDDFSDDGQYILVPKEGKDSWANIQKGIKIIFSGNDPMITPTIEILITNSPVKDSGRTKK